MTDQTGAAAASLADPAQPAAPAATTTTAVPGSVTPRTEPGAWQAPDWAKDWAAEDLGYIEKKGIRDPKDIYKQYRELERTLSDDRVALPKDWNNADEVNKFYNRAGRPESPDKYVAPQGSDDGMFKALAPGFHAAGLTQRQIDTLTKGYNDYAGAQLKSQADGWIQDQNVAQEKLEREWGANTPAEVEHNRRAMRALGMSVNDATNYMRNGAEKFLRLLNMAGHMIAEDNSGDIGSENSLGFGMTPTRAAAELQELKSSPEFMNKVRAKEPVAVAKYNRLIAAMSEGGVTRQTIKSGFKRNY
jgi:hypothetical protein